MLFSHLELQNSKDSKNKYVVVVLDLKVMELKFVASRSEFVFSELKLEDSLLLLSFDFL